MTLAIHFRLGMEGVLNCLICVHTHRNYICPQSECLSKLWSPLSLNEEKTAKSFLRMMCSCSAPQSAPFPPGPAKPSCASLGTSNYTSALIKEKQCSPRVGGEGMGIELITLWCKGVCWLSSLLRYSCI